MIPVKSRTPYARCWTGLLFVLVFTMHPESSATGSEKHVDAAAGDNKIVRQCDLAVYGATPGGVACAVRAAREGLDVVLVSHTEHLGGMLTNGLSTMDTLYNGSRAPLYDELRRSIYQHYAKRYGKESPQYAATQPGHPKTRYEASVVERLINDMLAAEPRVSVIKGYYPVAVSREASLLRSVIFQQMASGGTLVVAAEAFADCSYEADLAVVAGVPCRVGRDPRAEFNEPHAGVIYMRRVPWPPKDIDLVNFAEERRLNLFQYEAWYETIAESSTGEADPAVQGYNMRTIVTNDPGNVVPVEKPQNYDPEQFRKYGVGNPRSPGLSMPNRKFGMNEPKLIGKQDPYVEGDWAARREVTRQHSEATLGLLYFRQNDPSVPADIRDQWKAYGLPRDEFPDNGHVPYEIYARETRRIKGRAVFTEHDAQLASDLKRAPIHSDSISITEWFLDSHGCTPRHVSGSEHEGMVMLKNQTFPGQVSYQTLFPEGYKNLLVPVCLSSTHVGWGTIRLEPTWMSLGEAAAIAVTIAKRIGSTPADIDTRSLLRQLADRRVMISFFNDIEGKEEADWYPAVQYLGTQGYFGSYDARPSEPLTQNLADAWIAHASRSTDCRNEDPTTAARKVWAAEQKRGDPVTAQVFARRLTSGLAGMIPKSDSILDRLREWSIPPDRPITRGAACRLLYEAESTRAGTPRK